MSKFLSDEKLRDVNLCLVNKLFLKKRLRKMSRWSILLPPGWIGYSAEFAKTFVGFENLKFKIRKL